MRIAFVVIASVAALAVAACSSFSGQDGGVTHVATRAANLAG
jgi:hypothetical protein